MNEKRVLAVFDFDHTLITGDSMWPFLTDFAGWPRVLFSLSEAVLLLAIRYFKNKNDPALTDPRTFIKAHLLRHLLQGTPLHRFRPAIEATCRWQQWIAPMRQKLLDHHARGHHIVIASGSLDIYLPQLVKDLPHHALLCTRMEVIHDYTTGNMLSGNCVRQRKAEIVGEYIAAHGPFDESWGYGNFPHDVPMLNLLTHRILV